MFGYTIEVEISSLIGIKMGETENLNFHTSKTSPEVGDSSSSHISTIDLCNIPFV